MKISKLKTLFVALAAAASIPSAMAQGLPQGHQFVPNLYPFICNLFGPPTPVDGFSGYINIAGVKGLVIDLQTSQAPEGQFGLSTVGTFTLPPFPINAFNAHNIFTGLSLQLQGYCNDDGCSGPWIFVDAFDQKNNPMFGANVVCRSNFPGFGFGSCTDVGSDTSVFVTQSFTPASFGFTQRVGLAGVTMQLFPGCDMNHDSRIKNVMINGQHGVFETPRTIYNFCPTGFSVDPRPGLCNSSNGGSSSSF